MFFQSNEGDLLALPNSLRDIANNIPELLQSARADNTNKKYFYSFMRWKRWADSHNISQTFPVTNFHLCIYLSYLHQSGCTSSSLSAAFYGIRWAHVLVGEASPTDSTLCKTVFEGAKRILSKPVIKKDVITPEILKQMYDKYFDEANLFTQRIICISLLCYSGFLRSSEVLNLIRSDVRVSNTHMSVFIEHSKTDIYRDGAWVIISRTGSPLCPVQNIEIYFKLSSLMCDSSEYIFRNVTKCKSGYSLCTTNKALLYSRLRELFIQFFQDFVPDITKYGLHSLRAGGASKAANAGIPDRLFKRHGRWRSETAKDGYVKDDFSKLLSVSQCLGL